LNWLYSAFCQEANQPHSPMINQWCCEQHRIREVGLLPLHVDYLFKTGYYKEPESSPTWDLPRYMKTGKFKWRWERRLQSGLGEFAPFGRKVKTFSWGERRLVRGRTSCAGEGKGEGFSMAQEGGAQQNYVSPFGEIPAPPNYYGGVPMRAWGSGAAIPPPFLRCST
jgi:hypothetical protein